MTNQKCSFVYRLEFRYQMYGALSFFFLKLISIAYCICFLHLSFYKCIFLEIIFLFSLNLFCSWNCSSFFIFTYTYITEKVTYFLGIFLIWIFSKPFPCSFFFVKQFFSFFLFLYFPEKYKLFLYLSVFLLKTISYSPLYYCTEYVYEDV